MNQLIRTVIFDLDGTLIDTEPTAARVLTETFREWGLNPSPEDAEFVTGRTWENALNYIFSKYPVPLAREAAERMILGRYQEAIEKHLPVIPGCVETVRALSDSGRFKLGLVSGSHRATIHWALKRIGVQEHFEVILGAEDYPRSKPAPDGFRKATTLLGSDCASTLIFEDSRAGVESAIAAGCWVVAVTAANHFNQDTSKAHHRIRDFSEVDAKWIENLKLTR